MICLIHFPCQCSSKKCLTSDFPCHSSTALPIPSMPNILIGYQVTISSVQSLSHVWLFATPWIAAHQASLPSPTPGVHPNSCPSSRWCHLAISSSVIPFSSCPQSLPASESFPMSWLFTWGGQSIRVSALASVLPKNIQDWSPLEWTDWISLQSKGLSRVFSDTTVQKHQFFGTQLSSQSNFHIHAWPLEKTVLYTVYNCSDLMTTNRNRKRSTSRLHIVTLLI